MLKIKNKMVQINIYFSLLGIEKKNTAIRNLLAGIKPEPME
jgi:hypothetical protein